MKNNISSILQYSTIDFRFLELNLKQLSKFSNEIIIPISSHLFNGTLENEELINKSISIIDKYPIAKYVPFDWKGINRNSAYYHTLSRSIGTELATSDWLLFVDADEIVDDVFADWFDTIKSGNTKYWLTCNWYFRSPRFRSKTFEGCGLLIRKDQCKWNLEIRNERQQLFNGNFHHGGYNPILINGNPLVHHFSWVRSKDDMLKKVLNWGHFSDKDWVSLIHEEFSRDFNGTDFIHNYEYDIVEDKFGLGEFE